MRGLNSLLAVFIYLKKSYVKEIAFNLLLFWQVCSGHRNLFGNIAFKTYMDIQ